MSAPNPSTDSCPRIGKSEQCRFRRKLLRHSPNTYPHRIARSCFHRQRAHLNYRFLHDRCKEIAVRAGLDPKEWHLHRFRDTAATRWLRAGIDVRTVQMWLGHESLATTQKYLEPSKETERQLEAMRLPF